MFPFAKFPGVDTILGPEMRSTGEVMGIGTSVALAFGKSMVAASYALPDHGRAFISVQDDDKAAACSRRAPASEPGLPHRRDAAAPRTPSSARAFRWSASTR